MAATPADVSYLRLILHKDTDGLLMARKRTGPRCATIPEVRELRTLLRLLVEHGIEKIRLTGEDPAERTDLLELISLVASVDGVREVAMTTAGVGLSDRIGELAQRGLEVISFHLDTLKPERYAQLTGKDAFAEVWSAVEQSLAAGLAVKFNVVLQRGVNDDEIDDLVALTHDRPILVRFIEWNTLVERVAQPENFISAHEIMSAIKPPLIPRRPRSYDGPALVYDIPTHAGSVGFIPNITEHFCGACNRIGLTDHGEIMSCLFGRGLSLVRHLRSPSGVSSVSDFIDRVLRRKVLLSARLEGYAVAPAVAPPMEVPALPE
jgi:molybdenum cofactor biosynthesis enzyme MoaA